MPVRPLRSGLLATTLLLAACGGDDSSGFSEDASPDVTGDAPPPHDAAGSDAKDATSLPDGGDATMMMDASGDTTGMDAASDVTTVDANDAGVDAADASDASDANDASDASDARDDASDAGDAALPVPAVASTSPADGASAIASTAVSVTFSTPMDPTSLGTQTAAGPCTGTVQVSLDDFTTCIAMASASPAMSNGNTTATLTPAPGMLVNWTFKIRVTTAATSAGGVPLAAQFTLPNGFMTTSPPGPIVQNESNAMLEADFCNIQFPLALTVQAGQSTGAIYGRLYEQGVTPSGGTNPNLRAQVGYGPLSANPEYDASFTWFDASYNAACSGCGNNDEYMASFTAPAAGTYGYVFRMSLDQGASWTYCDKDGAGSNAALYFTFDQIAILIVTP